MGLVYLALYVGQGSLFNAAIRTWTGSPVSHCELLMPCGTWLSASATDGGVRPKRIEFNPEHWQLIPVPWANPAHIWRVYRQHAGKGYDWLGLFGSQLLNAGIDHKKRMFCSEFCAAALGFPQPQRFSPALLGDVVRRVQSITGQQDEQNAG